LALDESNAEDSIMDIDGFSFCIDKTLLSSIGGATIDISYMGFTIEPDQPLESESGSSGSSCSTCGTGGSCSI